MENLEFDREDVANIIFAVKIIEVEKYNFYPINNLINKLENWHSQLLEERLKTLNDEEALKYLEHLKNVEDLFYDIIGVVDRTKTIWKELKKQKPQ